MAVLWRRSGAHLVVAVVGARRLQGLSLYSGTDLALYEPLHVLLLCCPLQGRVHQKPQVTEVLGGEELWRRGRRGVEEPTIGARSGPRAGDNRGAAPSLLRLLQQTLSVQLHQGLDRTFPPGVAGAGQNGCRRVPQ